MRKRKRIYTSISEDILLLGKPVLITKHAVVQAYARDIAFPDQIYGTILTGKAERFGKKYVRVTKKTKNKTIICIGEDVGEYIILKTVTRK